MADTAEDETVEKCSELTDIKDKIVLSGLHNIPLRPKNKFGKGLLGNLGFWLSGIVFRGFSDVISASHLLTNYLIFNML